jgi:hypothetical protein
MVVVGHEAVGMANPIIPLVHMLKGVQEVDTILVVPEHGLFFVSTGCNVIDCTRVFYTERARHGRRISDEMVNVKPQDLTLKVRNVGEKD